ncbi:hypothetical protein ACFV42_23790 [Streptomyces solisilvae]|uniref:hypothetical protein n=1 Tax=Streptomyces malaysiensis TaxID=92644 RepID=UPI00367CC689
MSDGYTCSGRTVGSAVLAARPPVLRRPAVTREQVDAALFRDRLRRRAESGDVLAIAAVTGAAPADLYAEALAYAALEGDGP